MHVFLDHLASILIVSVLVLIFALLQFRGVQSNAESVVNHIVRSETLDIVEMLERDIINIRTPAQVTNAVSTGNYTGGAPTCDVTSSVAGDTTLIFSFPTLSNPQAGDTASVALVTYTLNRVVGSSVTRRDGSNADIIHPIYQLDRWIDTNFTGSSQATVTYFNIDFFRDGVVGPVLSGGCPTDMNRIRFQIQMAQAGIEETAPDQVSRSQLNFSRYGATLDLVNFE